MEDTRKLNVGGVTIIAKKLFNMEEYHKMKDEEDLGEYLTNLERQKELEDEGDYTKMGVILSIILLIFTTLVASELVVFAEYIEYGIHVLTLVWACLNFWTFYSVYKENKKYKKQQKEKTEVTKIIETIEKKRPVLVSLKEHAGRIYQGEFHPVDLKELLKYIDAIPTGKENVDVYLYRDPKDRELGYETHMLMFSTEDKDTYLRYDFQFLGEDVGNGEQVNVEVTTMRIFQIKVDDDGLLTENFTEKLKYLEVTSK